MSKQYKVEEVKRHNSTKSAWIIIHNDVYDVTTFLNEHPGGADSLMDVAGTDGTQPFEDVGHSEDARIMMKKYKIGTLPPGEYTKLIEKCTSSPPKSHYKPPSSPRPERGVSSIIVPRESSKLKWALIALAGALIVGFVLKKYTS